MSLDRIPRWALIAALTATMPVVGWALNSHLREDQQQTADIRELARITASLAEATENLKEVQRAQSEDQRMIRQDTNELLREMVRRSRGR